MVTPVFSTVVSFDTCLNYENIFRTNLNNYISAK